MKIAYMMSVLLNRLELYAHQRLFRRPFVLAVVVLVLTGWF